MQTVTLQSQTDSDGILHLNVPVDLINTEFKVTMMLHPIISNFQVSKELGWSPDFFEKTYGAWEGELIREQPTTYEKREEWT